MKVFNAFKNNNYFSHDGHCSDQAKDFNNSYDLLVLWGGEDISPGIYNQGPLYTSAPAKPSFRDQQEQIMLDKAVDFDVPVLGICRGAQLICAHFGGTLWQDVNGHGLGGSTHIMHTITGEQIPATSTHHQMMMPSEGMVLIGWTQGLATDRKTGGRAFDFWPDKEPEIVHVPWANALAVQGHPEYLNKQHVFPQYIFKLLKEILHV